MTTTRAQILEAIQGTIQRQQSVVHFAETARADAVAVLDALVKLARSLGPAHTDAGRIVDDLSAAAIRAGLTLASLSHLTAIRTHRQPKTIAIQVEIAVNSETADDLYDARVIPEELSTGLEDRGAAVNSISAKQRRTR